MLSCSALLLTEFFLLADDKLRVKKRGNVSVWIRVSRRGSNIRASKCFRRTLSANKAAEVLSEKGEFSCRLLVASHAPCLRNRFFGISFSPFQLVHLRSADTQMVLLRNYNLLWVSGGGLFYGKYINLKLALLRVRGYDCFIIAINNVRKTFPNDGYYGKVYLFLFVWSFFFLLVTSFVVKPAILWHIHSSILSLLASVSLYTCSSYVTGICYFSVVCLWSLTLTFYFTCNSFQFKRKIYFFKVR